MAKIYCIRREPFIRKNEIEDFFKAVDQANVSHVSPDNPKGGEVYVYYNPNEDDYWKIDGRRWANYGLKKIPKKEPIFYKVYHAAKTRDGPDPRFVRHGYSYIDKSSPYTIVHYLGDETLSFDKPMQGVRGSRRQSKGAAAAAKRAKLSNETDADESCGDGILAAGDVDSTLDDSQSFEGSQGSNTPELLKGVSLLRSHGSTPKKGSGSTLNTSSSVMYEISKNLTGFVKQLTVYPDAVCVMALDSATNALAQFLQKEQERKQAHLVLCTPNSKVWDMYVSYFIIHHPVFTFPLPIIYVLHERRSLKVHELLLRTLHETLPLADEIKFSITSDIERTYIFCEPLPARFKSWTGIKNDVLKLLKENNVHIFDVIRYINDIIDLVSCKTNDEFGILLKQKIVQWGKASRNDYLQRCLVSVFESHAKQWSNEAQEDKTANPEGEMLSPLTEIHAMIDKQGQEIDDAMLSLYFLHRYFTLEIEDKIKPEVEYLIVADIPTDPKQ